MSKSRFYLLAVLCVCAPWVQAQVHVQAQLPKRDLMVELRQIEEGRDGRESAEGYRAGTADPAQAWPPMSLVVRNGEKGVLRMQQAVPMQWVSSVQVQSSALSVPSAAASSSTGGLTQAVQWFDVGQSLTVTPKWSGGKKEVSLELEVHQADLQTATQADMPRQVRHQTSTTLTVPLNQWTTIAISGKDPAPAGSYSSQARVDARRLLQVRVSLP